MAKLGNYLNDLVKFHSDKMLSDNTECITYYHARRIQMRQNTRGTNPGYRLLGHTDTETKKNQSYVNLFGKYVVIIQHEKTIAYQ